MDKFTLLDCECAQRTYRSKTSHKRGMYKVKITTKQGKQVQLNLECIVCKKKTIYKLGGKQ